MYRFVSSYLKPRGAAYTYQDIDISLKTIDYIQKEYIDGYIELSNPALSDNIFITIQEFRELKLPHRLDQTFEYWLAYIKNRTINGTESRPNYETNIVRARNAAQASYKFNLCKRTLAPNANIAVGDMNDVYLHKSGVNLKMLRERSLVTVNGYLHPHVPYYDGIAIVGGGSQHKLIGELMVGILSFATIGDIQMIPITKERISKYSDGVLYSDRVVIDTGRDLTNKSVIVSIAGYPLISSPLVNVVSDATGVIKLNMRGFDIVRHVNNSVGEINLESCGIVTPNEDLGMPPLSMNYLRSDIMMLQYLTLPQSFIAIIDAPTLTVDRFPVTSTGVPHRHISESEPNMPMMDSNGKLVEYWIDPQNGPFSVMTRPDYYKTYLYETTQQNEPDKHTRVLPVGGYLEHSYDFLRLTSVKKV
jgi:hypothetical protein